MNTTIGKKIKGVTYFLQDDSLDNSHYIRKSNLPTDKILYELNNTELKKLNDMSRWNI